MKTNDLLLLIALFLIIFGLGGRVTIQTKEITIIADAGVAIIILIIIYRRKKQKN